MLSYILKQFHSFIPDAKLEDSILKYNPIPSNVPPPFPPWWILERVLEENHKYSQMQEEKLLQKMQQKVLDVLGPMSKIWQKIEDSTQCRTDRVEIDLCGFKELTEQSITKLGQVFNNITYNRRLSALNALLKKHKSKLMLKLAASIFSESYKKFFGQNFREDWCASLKTKQKYQVLRKETKSTTTTFNRNRPPFRGGPPASYRRGSGGRAPQAFFVRSMPQTQRQHGKSDKITLPQHSTTPQLESPDCLIKEDQRKNNNIFGRHASNDPNIERNFASKGDIDFSVTKFRFCDKYKKFAINTSEANRIFSVSDKFSKHNISLTPRKKF